MVDTNFALRATLPIPGGVARKLWVIFAFGAASYRAEHLELDREELATEQARTGGTVVADESSSETARDSVARLGESLPIGTPDDWVLAGSQALWDEYEIKARETAAKFGRELDATKVAMLMRRYQSLCVVAARYAYDVPQLTPDPDDDLLVYDALKLGVDIFISDDPHVVPNSSDGCKEYEHEDMRLQAMRSVYFIEHYCDQIDWDEIDGALI